ncbi:MAG: right-handed parallel beta-helix repeat-containing protein, partial [Bacteroidales bacterium]|nr:right-handed parallel beta-helix repeat-containing protein [Bacteroidales bacterium]
ENSDAVISNNIISDNHSGTGGGGIYLENSNATISNNIITNNTSDYTGGGIDIEYSNPVISNNRVANNNASAFGGGLYIYYSNPVLLNNAICNNTTYFGGAIYIENSDPAILNNTISDNNGDYGGGILFDFGANPDVRNTIIYGNTASENGNQVCLNNTNPNFYYCDIQGGTNDFGINGGESYTGDFENCIDSDPLYTGTAEHPYNIHVLSPCINSGDTATTTNDAGEYDLAGNSRILFNRIDIGAYETFKPIDNFPGYTLEFDGTNDYVLINPLWETSPTEFTCEGWIYPTLGSGEVIFFHGDNGEFMLEIHNGALEFKVLLQESGWFTTSMPSFPLNEWNHVAGVWKKNNYLKLYVNGELTDDITVPDKYLSDPGSAYQPCFGSYHGQSGYYNGKIDEFCVLNEEKTQTEIRENMHLTLNASNSLLSYNQFNEGSGNIAYNYYFGNNGTLTNMDTANCWVESSIPFGSGISNSQIETAGTVDFAGTDLVMNFISFGNASITATRIDTTPNINPIEPDIVFNEQYWVVNRYGTGIYNVDLTFTLNEDLYPADENNPANLRLYSRGSNADTNWAYITPASTVNAENNEATFTGITDFGQFVIGRFIYPDIFVEEDSLNYEKIKTYHSISKKLTIYNNGSKELNVTDISNIHSVFVIDTTSVTIPPNDSLNITITFTPDLQAIFSDTLTIISDDPDTPVIIVMLAGEGMDEIDNYPGTALNFDGVNDYISCGNAENLNITDSVTVEAWINAGTWKTHVYQGGIVGKDKSDHTGYILRCGDNGRLSFVVGISGSWHEVISGHIMASGEWYHVAGVYDGSYLRIYINGELTGKQSLSGTIGVSSKSLRIGASPGFSHRYFDGKIDEVRIWDNARDSTQIRENMYLTLTG